MEPSTPIAEAPPDVLLTFDGISKHFGGVQAVRDVRFDVRAGRVLGLIGENGAGKSTLMNVLGGVVQPDAGRMRFAGGPYAPADPAEAARAGIAFIHQELNLFPNLSIADNLFVGRYPRVGRLPLVHRSRARRRAEEILALVSLDVPPDTLVERLSPGERQLVEIARALSADARLIIFDEPTTSLTAREAERLFALIERVRRSGTAVIYISHTLGDVLTLADDIVVLRDGEVVDQGPRDGFTIDRMITAMVGRRLEQLFPPRTTEPTDDVLLDVRGLTQPGVVRDVGFTLHRGELLGLFGLMGAGRSELARILFGLDPFASGEILLGGEPCAPGRTRRRIRDGMAFVTENRREEGLMLDASVVENIGLAALPRFAGPGPAFVDRGRLRRAVGEMSEALRIRSDDPVRQPVAHLSGGNQQKAVIAKWLLTEPSVFVMDEPTRGIDVGAKYDVYTIIRDLAAGGAGVLCISSEVEELMGLCDRILVMRRGEIRGAFARPFDQERMLLAAFGEEGRPV